MATLDTSTDRGRHVERRLREDIIGWLTTVRPSGQPDSVPVWFLWDGEAILVYSRPEQTKMQNIAHNPRVTFTVDDTKGGGDVIRVEGTAEYAGDFVPSHENVAYQEKYSSGIARIGYDAEEFAASYSAAVVITPTRFRV
ncbi:MAG TPA: TIGR03667 family PPOX class F420-dependent oxidoreductase [Thermomicrobiales bacterium]|nr:TIGR03667 family PPOX class F420-dependent oxidoreductase [Thermomicrobiales bacterium]